MFHSSRIMDKLCKTSENREMEITATIDGRVKTIAEASIRRHLKLEDFDGISSLPNTEIFEQLALMGTIFEGMVKNLDSKSKILMYPRFIQIFLNKHKRLLLPHNKTYIAPTLTHKLFSNMRKASKGYIQVDILLFLTMLVQGPNLQGQGSTIQSDSHHTTTSALFTSQPPTSPPSMQITHIAEEAATFPHDSPLLRVYLLRSDKGSMTLHELTVLCTTLSKKVESLETDLKQTKLTYGAAFTKLIIKVKRLEKKSVTTKLEESQDCCVVWDAEKRYFPNRGGVLMKILIQDAGVSGQIDAKDQGRFEDETDTQILADVARVHTYSKRRRTISTSSGGISTAEELVSTVGASMPVSTTGMDQESIPSPSASKDKGKVIMTEFKTEQAPTKLKQRQERMAQVHQAAQGFIDAEWDDIWARVAADEDLVQQLQAGEKYSEEDLPMKLMELVNQRKKVLFFAQKELKLKKKTSI
ncbi:hypothetical protein Tco_0322341 [Tanacetum coccineum]